MPYSYLAASVVNVHDMNHGFSKLITQRTRLRLKHKYQLQDGSRYEGLNTSCEHWQTRQRNKLTPRDPKFLLFKKPNLTFPVTARPYSKTCKLDTFIKGLFDPDCSSFQGPDRGFLCKLTVHSGFPHDKDNNDGIFWFACARFLSTNYLKYVWLVCACDICEFIFIVLSLVKLCSLYIVFLQVWSLTTCGLVCVSLI